MTTYSPRVAAGHRPDLAASDGIAAATSAARSRIRVRLSVSKLSPWVATGLALVLAVQMAAAVAAVRSAATPPFASLAAVLVAGVLATVLLRRPLRGPDIHDRQLDLILATGASAAAVVLAVAQLSGSAHALGLLAPVATAVAVLAAVVGTRRLWQLVPVLVVLAAGWPGPWAGQGPLVPLAAVAAVTVLVSGSLLLSARRHEARDRNARRRHAAPRPTVLHGPDGTPARPAPALAA